MSLALVITGAILVTPTLISRAQAQVTSGRIADVLPAFETLDNGEVQARLQLLFEFPLRGSLAQPEILALGFGRANLYGQELDDPRVPASELSRAMAPYLQAIERGTIFQVTYRADNPYESARIHADGMGMWRLSLGVICILTPIILWIARFGLRGLGRIARRRPSP